MSEIERKRYMENEIKYLEFFQMLFDLNNQELMIRINFISNLDINEFFENEKNSFVEELYSSFITIKKIEKSKSKYWKPNWHSKPSLLHISRFKIR